MSENYKIYTIESGDNLTAIARQFDTTIQAIVDLNGIENPNLIYAGSELRIPLTEAELAQAVEANRLAELAHAEEVKKAEAAAALEEAKIKADFWAKQEAEAKAAEEAKKSKTILGKISGLFDKKDDQK